jgi:putative zinc finger/helix-turn-helix YgiT family protein
MNLFYCPECNDDSPTRIEHREITSKIKGEEVTVCVPVRVCETCGESIYDEDLDTDAQQKAFDVYRKRHNLISPDELRHLRHQYGLTQQGLSTLLGWGAVTIHRYEMGSLPDEAHNQVLRFIKDPANMLQLVRCYEDRLAPEVLHMVKGRLLELIQVNAPEKMRSLLDAPLSWQSFNQVEIDTAPDVLIMDGPKQLTCYQVADYFLSVAEDLNDTLTNLKVQKLVYYAQGVHLALRGKPLFRERIEAWQHGPVVPDLYHALKRFGDKPIDPPSGLDMMAYPEEYLITMDVVFKVFGQFSAWKLRDMTHEEDPWKNTFSGGEITLDALEAYFRKRMTGNDC